MRFSVAFVASLVAIVSAAPNAEHIFAKRACSGDNCLRAINNPASLAQASSDCSAYFATVVTPCPVTTTVSATVTSTASGTTITSQETNTIVTTQTVYNVATVLTSTTITNNVTSTSKSTIVSTTYVTTTITTGSVGLSMKKRQAACTPVTSSGTIPTYASVCAATTSTGLATTVTATATNTRYSSACNCLGVSSTPGAVITLSASTVTVTNTATASAAGSLTTTTSSANVTSTVFQSTTNTTTLVSSTTTTATLSVTSLTSTTTTVTSTSVVPTCSSIVLRVTSDTPYFGNYVTDAGTMRVDGSASNATVFTLLRNGTVAHYDPMNSGSDYFLATANGALGFINKQYLSQSNGNTSYSPINCKVDASSKDFVCRAYRFSRSSGFDSCSDQPGSLFIGGTGSTCTALTLAAVARCSGASTVA